MVGPIKNINIIRDNGFIVKNAYIRQSKDRESLHDFLIFDKSHPKLMVSWMQYYHTSDPNISDPHTILPIHDLTKIYTKQQSYNKLSQLNLHLPLIIIKGRSHYDNSIQKKINIKNQDLYQYCTLVNQATRLIVVSYKKTSGLFSLLPIELIKIIIHYYFS